MRQASSREQTSPLHASTYERRCQTSGVNDSEKALQEFTVVGRVFLCFIWCFDVANGFILPWGDADAHSADVNWIYQ